MSSVTCAEIEQALRAALAPLAIAVDDDSAAHAGHPGALEGRHFTVRITSAAFVGQGRLARHRLVYDALRLVIPRGIHALAIVARAPDESDSSPSPPALR